MCDRNDGMSNDVVDGIFYAEDRHKSQITSNYL